LAASTKQIVGSRFLLLFLFIAPSPPQFLGIAAMKGWDKGYHYTILNGSWLDHPVIDHSQDREQFRDSLTD